MRTAPLALDAEEPLIDESPQLPNGGIPTEFEHLAVLGVLKLGPRAEVLAQLGQTRFQKRARLVKVRCHPVDGSSAGRLRR